MSNVNKQQFAIFDAQKTYERYSRGSNGGVQLIGTEVEQWLIAAKGPPRMMSPQQSQAILRKIAMAPGARSFVEEKGVKKPGFDPDLPVVYVSKDQINYQLELCGVLEMATEPVPVSDLPKLLRLIDRGQAEIKAAAVAEGLVPYPCAVLGSATVADCEKNMVARERLRSEWARFSRDGADSAGLRTMGLATSVQVSIGYRDAAELREIMTLGNFLSPLLTAAFANTTGFAENKPTEALSRPSWWLLHNKTAPRGGMPDEIVAAMKATDGDFSRAWIDYVMRVPMVYYFDAGGNASFDRSPTFIDLQKEGLGTQANFALASSLVWPDVKLIDGQRVELRMCDAGPWQAKALTVLAATLLADPVSRRTLFALLGKTGITAEKLMQARVDICIKSLDADFGNTTLRAFLPEVAALARLRGTAQGLGPAELDCLRRFEKRPVVSDEERLRKVFNKVASAAEADKRLVCGRSVRPRRSFRKPPR